MFDVRHRHSLQMKSESIVLNHYYVFVFDSTFDLFLPRIYFLMICLPASRLHWNCHFSISVLWLYRFSVDVFHLASSLFCTHLQSYIFEFCIFESRSIQIIEPLFSLNNSPLPSNTCISSIQHFICTRAQHVYGPRCHCRSSIPILSPRLPLCSSHPPVEFTSFTHRLMLNNNCQVFFLCVVVVS